MKKIACKIMAAAVIIAMVLTVGFFHTSPVRADGDGVKIHVYNTLGWENVYVHSWSTGSNAPQMTPMIPSESENWYEFTFDSAMGTDFVFLMYNGSWKGLNQTGDLKVTSGDEIYYVIQAELGEGSLSTAAAVKTYASEEEAKGAGYPVYDPAAAAVTKAPAATTAASETTAAATAVVSETAAPVTATLYFKNSGSWSKASIWAWTMKYTDQMVVNAWPGDKMTDLGNGWMSYEIKASEDYAVLFNDGDKIQTADSTGLTAGKSYWFVIGDGTVVNDTGIGGGAAVTAYQAPEAGWPEGPAAAAAAVTPAVKSNGFIVWYVVGGAAVVVALAAGIAVAVRKKRSK